MDIGAHIPAYLFSEQFAHKARVLDIHPPDETGTRLLAKVAGSLVLVQKTLAGHTATEETKFQRFVSTADALPFGRDSFDFVFFFARGEAARPQSVDDFLRAARSILTQSGLLALVIPNRDAKSFERRPEPPLLDFFGLERNLRRHFPHVTLFAQRPLHGATLSPLGRGDAAYAPLLDDRLLPEGGEVPSHFFALCAPRYRKVDDSTIAQLPYDLLVDSVRQEINELRGKMSFLRNENKMRARDNEKLEIRCQDASTQAAEIEKLRHDKVQAEKRAADSERKLDLKSQLELEYQRIQDDLRSRLSESDESLHNENRKNRNLVQRITEEEQTTQLAFRERQEAEEEREKAVASARKIRAELKTKQRELDDIREEMAGLDNELETLRKENAKHRREALAYKEQVNRLEIEVGELQKSYVDSSVQSAELSRLRTLAASERERLEQLLENEHKQLAENEVARASAEQRAGDLEKERDEARREIEYAQRRTNNLEERLKEAQNQRAALEQQRQGAEQAGEDWARQAREHSDELERHKHQVDLLSKRATGAERRSTELEQQIEELTGGLRETESTLGRALDAEKKLTAELQSLKDENRRLADSLETATLKNVARKKAFESLRQRLDSIQQEESAKELREDALTRELKENAEDKRSLAAENDRLTGDLEQERLRVQELTERVQERTERVQELTESVQELTERAQERTERVQELTESVRELTEHAQKQTERAQEQTERAQKLAVKLDIEQTPKKQWEAEKQDLITQNRQLQAKLTGITDRESTLAKSIDSLRAKLETADNTQQSLENRILDHEIENADLKKRLSEAFENATKIKTKMELSSSSNSERESELEQAKAGAREAGNRARESAERALQAKRRIDDLEEGLEKALQALSALSEELSESRKLQQAYQKTIKSHESSEREIQQKRQDTQNEMRRLLGEKEAELLQVSDDLEKELRHATSRYEASQGEVWELREEVLRLKAQVAATAASEEQQRKKKDRKLKLTPKPKQQLYATDIPPLLDDFSDPAPADFTGETQDDDALFDELHAKLDQLEDDTDF